MSGGLAPGADRGAEILVHGPHQHPRAVRLAQLANCLGCEASHICRRHRRFHSLVINIGQGPELGYRGHGQSRIPITWERPTCKTSHP